MTAEPLPFSFLRKAAEITGWSHGDLASISGIPRSSVQAIIAGRYAEHLNARQIQAITDAVRLFRDRIIQGVEEMEMM